MVFELVKICVEESEFFFFFFSVVTLVFSLFSHITSHLSLSLSLAVSAIQQIQKVLHTLKQREQVSSKRSSNNPALGSASLHSLLTHSLPQHYLDKLTPHVVARWCVSAGLLALYGVRVYVLEGFYIVSYGLAIYLLNLLLGFISPKIDPEFASLGIDDDDDSVAAPLGTTSASAPSAAGKNDEFKPFIRRLPEFKFWLAVVRASALAIVLTLFPFLDIPGESRHSRCRTLALTWGPGWLTANPHRFAVAFQCSGPSLCSTSACSSS
jgi:hypothetical protein